MRQASGIPLTIAISAGVHVALFGAAYWLPDPPRFAPDKPVVIELVPPTPVADIVPPDIASTEVVFLDDTIDPRHIDPSHIDPNHIDPNHIDPSHIDPNHIDPNHIDPNHIDRSTPPATASLSHLPKTNSELPSSDTPPASDTPTTRNPYLDMRRAPRPGTFVRGHWDDLENVPKGTTPQKDISTGQLAPDGGGTHKSDQGAFTAKIEKDGSVSLKDKKNFSIRFALPNAKQLGDMIQAWYYDPNKPVGTLPPPNMPKRQANLTREDVSGAERLYGSDAPLYAHEKDPTPPTAGVGLPILAGGFDITDAFMRSKGVDPYASKKLAFLDSTRDERVRIGNTYKSQQLAQVAQIVKKNLARVWAATNDPQQRKQALFEMWDECVETGSAEVVEAASTARKIIIGVARANFPAGSEHAFTATEIAACNRAKQSSALFAPYQ